LFVYLYSPVYLFIQFALFLMISLALSAMKKRMHWLETRISCTMRRLRKTIYMWRRHSKSLGNLSCQKRSDSSLCHAPRSRCSVLLGEYERCECLNRIVKSVQL
jgi:hypothetical protein